MKKIIITVLAMLVSSTALAQYNPSYERPILTAQNMEITKVESSDLVNMTLNKKDGSQNPTSLRLVAETKDGESVNVLLPIVNVEEDPCGTIVYVAKTNNGNMAVELVDHTERFCEDYRPFKWEADVTADGDQYGLLGNPEAVFSTL